MSSVNLPTVLLLWFLAAFYFFTFCQEEGHTVAPHLTVVGLQPSIRQEPQHWLSDR